MDVKTLIVRAAREYPDNLALVYKTTRMTFGELNQASNRLAHGILALGVRKGDRVGMFLHNHAEFIEIDFALSKAGIVRVSPSRVEPGWLDLILHPAEPPIAEASAVESIRIDYPSQWMNLFGWHLHWLVVYFALSVLFGLGLKGVLRVEA